MAEQNESRKILLTGATGYIGGRLAPLLLERGYHVRCFARSPDKLQARSWHDHPHLEVVQGDVNDAEGLAKAMQGCDATYYLIHSMESAGTEYAERDRKMAASFAEVASHSSLQRIVYLGGLGELGPGLSEHLQSRREVEEELSRSRVPLTAFRAAMIIGSGSASFEILRYLVERLPVMVTPKWVSTETQPIAVRNVLQYLMDCLEVPEAGDKTIDIGGPDIFDYRTIMQIMAEELEISRRVIIPVPVLTPRISSLWIGLVTPVNNRIARPLAEGLRNKTVCRNDLAKQLLPQEHLLTVKESIDQALKKASLGEIETNWSTAGPIPGDPDWAGGKICLDERSREVDASAAKTFQTVCRIGGKHGYWGADYLWRLRGFMDQMIGGPGLRRGRRHPTNLRYGEAVDFWRVRGLKQDRLLTLHAEMWLPGEAELTFEIEELGQNKSRIKQIARFSPRGLLGLAYWYAVTPMHYFVFQRMINGIASEAEQMAAKTDEQSREETDDSVEVNRDVVDKADMAEQKEG